VSIDGLAPTHDAMRARRGSFEDGLRAIAAIAEAGMVVQANTNFNRLNEKDPEPLYERLRDAGVKAWQVQLTSPLGRAADRPDMLLQPWELLDLLPRLAEIKRRGFREGLLVMPGNNLGYFGPEEALLRTPFEGGADHFRGCMAGRYVMGIESDGAVKGCPSLQSASYVGGTLREQPLASIWSDSKELAFTRARTRDDLWGFCRECPYAEVCMGGCSFTAHGFFGKTGNNPYCHFRAMEHRRRGLRERLVATDAASGLPFDHGLFELVVEPFDAPLPEVDRSPGSLVKIGRKPKRLDPERASR
jgi:radical SAM protein with 4Fe4S-binding SPASM domain